MVRTDMRRTKPFPQTKKDTDKRTLKDNLYRLLRAAVKQSDLSMDEVAEANAEILGDVIREIKAENAYLSGMSLLKKQ